MTFEEDVCRVVGHEPRGSGIDYKLSPNDPTDGYGTDYRCNRCENIYTVITSRGKTWQTYTAIQKSSDWKSLFL